MTKPWMPTVVACLMLLASSMVLADLAKDELPAGPIRDRHELMKKIGEQAKTVNDALKSGQLGPVAGAADKIEVAAREILPLFPAVSTHPKSRAKEEIWQNWAKFEEATKRLEVTAGGLVTAAEHGGDVQTATKAMFGACKSCHDQFRKPEEK